MTENQDEELKRRNERKTILMNEASRFRAELAQKEEVAIEAYILHEDRLFVAVDEYFNAIDAYKAKHRFRSGERVGASKIAAMTVYFILTNRPFEPSDLDNMTMTQGLINEYFAWHVTTVLLELDQGLLGDEEGVMVVEQILYNMENAPESREQAETWNITLANHLEKRFNPNFNLCFDNGENYDNNHWD